MGCDCSNEVKEACYFDSDERIEEEALLTDGKLLSRRNRAIHLYRMLELWSLFSIETGRIIVSFLIDFQRIDSDLDIDVFLEKFEHVGGGWYMPRDYERRDLFFSIEVEHKGRKSWQQLVKADRTLFKDRWTTIPQLYFTQVKKDLDAVLCNYSKKDVIVSLVITFFRTKTNVGRDDMSVTLDEIYVNSTQVTHKVFAKVGHEKMRLKDTQDDTAVTGYVVDITDELFEYC